MKSAYVLLSSFLLSTANSLVFGGIIGDDIKKIPWPMYQQNADHTGYINADLLPRNFKFEWKQTIGEAASPGLNYSISGAVVADNIVYVSRHNYAYSNTLQAFSVTNGKELWKKSYGNVSVNPPSIVKGKVYVQTVNNSSPDTALYAYDAKTGKIIFKSPTSAQWESYLAPTIFNNTIYIDGGSYGGMYSIDADSGKQNWFAPLAQFDMWTPAVNNQYAIAYTNGNLNVLDRVTGKTVVNIHDPNFAWHGYSTNFAPVLVDNVNVIVIESGYITFFDIKNKNIIWSVGPGFRGQPAYDNQYIYASKNDGLVVLNKKGKVMWQWLQDNEHVNGQFVVTKNLVFLTTNKATYAISKAKQEVVWSYPATGLLSLGMGYLFISEHAGNLTAIKLVR